MGSKFIPPPDQINTIGSKKSKKSFSDLSSQSIFHEIKRNIRDSYKYDAFEQVGQLHAIVLEVIDEEPTKMLWKNPLMSYAFYEKNTMPDYVEIRFRVPEIHAHLPEPENPEDFIAINRHPKAIMKKDKGIPEVGDIVTLDFKDKNNFTHAMVVESLNSNEGPNPGGNCSPANTFESGTPPLNTSPPTGDTQSPPAESYSATNDPSPESFDVGVDRTYSSSVYDDTGMWWKTLKQACYVISIDEFNTLPEFNNLDELINALATKNAFSLCFQVADKERLLRDTTRLIKIMNKLEENNFNCSLMISSIDGDTGKSFRKNLVHMANIAKVTKVKSIIYKIESISSGSFRSRWQVALRNLADSIGAEFNIALTDDTNFTNSLTQGRQAHLVSGGELLVDKIFLSGNVYDHAKSKTENSLLLQLKKEETKLISGFDSSVGGDKYRIRVGIHLSGINFLANSASNDSTEKCLAGRRSSKILEADLTNQDNVDAIKESTFDYFSKTELCLFYDYNSLDSSLVAVIEGTSFPINDDKKQSLLSSELVINKADKTNVEDIIGTGSDREIEEPVFNSSGGSQDVSPMPVAPETPSSPGAQCTPFNGGATDVGSTNAGSAGSGAPVTPPSYRFDSIENYQNLGWAASAHHIINDVIFEYMERFSAAVYRRLPANSPSFTGSVPKKIKLTSTARTAQKQVELMWDKIRQGGDNAVWNLYGRSSWVTTVVNQYHAGDMQPAIQVIQKRIDDGIVTGHLSGKGIDVHTWSHLDAEGINSNGASVDTMNSSKFVQAIVAAARECNSRPVVESYQQHVHITIL